jgi:amino acid transporter
MENEATQSIIAMGIAYVIVGILLRVIIILTMVMIVRSLVTDKKKKKKVTLSIKDEPSKLFIGYVAMIALFYYIWVDFAYGFKENFNSLIWFGLFIVEFALVIPHIMNKIIQAIKPKENKTKGA